MSVLEFGSGSLHIKSVAGNQATNPTPFRAIVLQEVTLDFKGDLKKLYGQSQLPVATARGKIDCSIKGKMAGLDVRMWNEVFWAQTATAGIDIMADQEAATIPATPFQVTVVNSANFLHVTANPDGDFGVQFASNGQQLVKVASGPTTGQYSVNTATGVYTFAAADTGLGVLISYMWNSAARGTNLVIANQLMGYAPEIAMNLFGNFRSKYFGVRLNDVTLGDVSVPTKLEDFWMADFTGSANADASGNLGKWYSDNV